MNHYKPHPGSTFEGYYSKFRLPSGAHIALIVCSVPKAKERPHMISFTYYPPTTTDASHVFQREIWTDIALQPGSPDSEEIAFTQKFQGGHVVCHTDGTTEYLVEDESFTFRARTDPSTQTSWTPNMDTPEGILVHLPLPLHWHVQSLSTSCDFSLLIRDPTYTHLSDPDRSGVATVHQEKNWANSFPSAHIWVQARNEELKSGMCIAGGQIMGMEAFLLSYRASIPDYSMSFRPPLALKALGFSPSMSVSSSWHDRSFSLSVRSWSRRIEVHASAPKGSFFGLSAPFADGHRENFLGESFRTTVTVKVYEAGMFSTHWKLVHQESFDNASLEFGAGYYPPAGSDEKVH